MSRYRGIWAKLKLSGQGEGLTAAGLATHPEALLLPEALHGALQPQELVRLQKEVQILQERLAGIPFLLL